MIVISGGATPQGGTIYSTYATRPAASSSGKIWNGSDTRITTWVDAGSWRPIICGVKGYEPPDVSTWTDVNPGGSTTTITKAGGAIDIVGQNEGPNFITRGRYVLGTPTNIDFVLNFRSSAAFAVGNTPIIAPGLLKVSSGKSFTAGAYVDHGVGCVKGYAQYHSNLSTRASGTAFTAPIDSNGPIFCRIKQDGVNAYFYWSRDGDANNWVQVYSAALVTVFGAGPVLPDAYGIFAFGYNDEPEGHILSFVTS